MPLRTPPTSSPASLDPRDEPGFTLLRYTFRLITPMHGGGVTSKECLKPHDPVTPIRVASIRGQLRFWWRACGRPAPLTDLKQLHDQESAIWGSTSIPSPTAIFVQRRPGAPRAVVVFARDHRNRYSPTPDMKEVAYGAFPLKPGERSENQPGTLHDFSAGTFTLEVRLSNEHSEDIVTALQAWVLFGGLGGRTRRGFGAIEHCPSAAGNADDTPFEVPAPQDFLDRLARRHTLPGIPSLVGATLKLSNRSHAKPEAAWKNALGALRKLRQEPNLGRDPGKQPNHPGRSRWPEPDAIRSLLPPPRGVKYAHRVEHQIQKFPRAAFGLPIIFHFTTRGDPDDTTLTPKDHERLASPLILRPLRQGSNYCALALLLRGTALADPLVLKPKNAPARDVDASLTAAEAAQIKPLNGHTSPLDAFLDHFEKTAP